LVEAGSFLLQAKVFGSQSFIELSTLIIRAMLGHLPIS